MIVGILALILAAYAGYFAVTRFKIFIKGLGYTFLGAFAGICFSPVIESLAGKIVNSNQNDNLNSIIMFIFAAIGVVVTNGYYAVDLRKKGHDFKDIAFSLFHGFLWVIMFIVYIDIFIKTA